MHWNHRLAWLIPLTLFFFTGCAGINRYQTDGNTVLEGIDAPITIVRDEKGMAYVHAAGLNDAIFGVGFVTAQDRLFQMTLNRYFAAGRLCELFGKTQRDLDVRNRTLGFYRHAHAHAQVLEGRTRRFLRRYVDGINACIETGRDRLALEFKLANVSPTPWTIVDVLAIYYAMGWNTSANAKTEVIAHMLVEKLGEAKAKQIFPLSINPDDATHPADEPFRAGTPTGLNLVSDLKLMAFFNDGPMEMGSNNWVVGPVMAEGGKPVVCNDPHMRTDVLPGPLYPVGIVTPDLRVVGASLPGLAGMPVFRSDHIAVGVTNAYVDVQDLYIETIAKDHADHYLEGRTAIPFTIVEETIRIKDKEAESGFRSETIRIRSTKRGPVVSDVMPGLETDMVLSVRWAPYETMAATLGFLPLLTATSVESAMAAIGQINVVSLNFVLADRAGNIAWVVSGRLPIRADGDGTLPFAITDSHDNWCGFVPFREMPQSINPDKGWLGTCNHRTVAHDYPYYYSSYQSTSYRYRRLKHLMGGPDKKSVDDHWRFQRDTLNLMAQRLVPIMVDLLNSAPQTRELAGMLSRWDLHDDSQSVGATVFHAIVERFAWLTFADELGEDLARKMLDLWYFWQERFHHMVVADHLDHWFDDIQTSQTVETKRTILIRAALEAEADLRATLGENRQRWRWGRLHRHTFVSPLRRRGIGKALLGGGTHAADGSGEVLYRGVYAYSAPYAVTASAALRMVADLADEEKVLAVVAGGVTERMFHPHATDQIAAYMSGAKVYWWFSEQAIADHTRSLLVLTPATAEPTD